MLKHQDVLILCDIYANAVAEENLIIYHNTTDVVSVYKEGEHLYSNETYTTVGTTRPRYAEKLHMHRSSVTSNIKLQKS